LWANGGRLSLRFSTTDVALTVCTQLSLVAATNAIKPGRGAPEVAPFPGKGDCSFRLKQ
jgi:hypothetical protein